MVLDVPTCSQWLSSGATSCRDSLSLSLVPWSRSYRGSSSNSSSIIYALSPRSPTAPSIYVSPSIAFVFIVYLPSLVFYDIWNCVLFSISRSTPHAPSPKCNQEPYTHRLYNCRKYSHILYLPRKCIRNIWVNRFLCSWLKVIIEYIESI